jgi:hypothetical protein
MISRTELSAAVTSLLRTSLLCGHRELYGLVEGDRLAFRVIASVDNDVEELKRLAMVQLEKKRGSLRGVDDADLVLWKVSHYLCNIVHVNVNAVAHGFWVAPHTSTYRIYPIHSRPPIIPSQRALTTWCRSE